MRISRTALVASTLLLLPACAAPRTATPPAPGPTGAALPPAVHWVRNSAEHRAVFLQTYRAASERARELARGREAGTWAVILDADETVLDNSTYQMRLARRGEAFSNETWNAWVREEAAAAQPGAARFIELVRGLGGRVAIVTNRDEPVCDATRRNLAALVIEVDVVLCQAEGEQGKEGRFAAVREGTTPAGLPPLDVVMWVGDNIHDFPGLDQRVREGPPGPYEPFGRRWFVLPNPMYGSWERNPAG